MQDSATLRNIPQELKMNGLWCGWRLTERGKIPFNLSTGEHARSNDESTFSPYPVLLNNLHKFLRYDGDKQVGGIGLGIFRGYSAIDIDHCVDGNGNLSDMARDIVSFIGSYTEYSPSRTGIRVIFKTSVRIDKATHYINNRNNGLEIYISDNTNKFVSITGNKISGDTIEECDITPILDKYMRKGEFSITKAIEKDEKLRSLWNAVAPGSGANESETDMALACKLAFYAKNDLTEMRRLFESSPYFASKDDAHKRKWATEYAENTLRNAVSFAGVTPAVQTFRPAQKRYELNDTGNAHRFADDFGDDVRYNVDNRQWMTWNGRFWQFDVAESIKNHVEIMAERMAYESISVPDMGERIKMMKNVDYIYGSSGKENLLREARHLPGIPVTNADLDANRDLVCHRDGTLDLSTGKTRESRREDMISMTADCGMGTKRPERFIRFLKEIFADDEVVHYVHKALGYSMSDRTREQCMFILHGDGNNGKSLLLDVIATILGSYAVFSRPQLLTENDFGKQNTEEIARLKGKRFCAVEEIKAGDKLDEQLVKLFTSGIGKVTARFLYANSFEFPVTCKIWMATNYEPVVRGTDKGIWRRIVEIPVPTDFTGREDKDLRDELLSERDGIFAWLAEGYRLYCEEGLKRPVAVEKATSAYRREMDIVQQWIEERCETDKEAYERANTLYSDFRAYCQQRDLRTNQTAFGRNLGKKFGKYNSGEGIVYFGIRLRKGADGLARKVAYERTKVDDDV